MENNLVDFLSKNIHILTSVGCTESPELSHAVAKLDQELQHDWNENLSADEANAIVIKYFKLIHHLSYLYPSNLF